MNSLIEYLKTEINSKQYEIIDPDRAKLYRTALAFEFFTNIKLTKQNANILGQFLKQAFENYNQSIF
jgi:hypothetical protein